MEDLYGKVFYPIMVPWLGTLWGVLPGVFGLLYLGFTFQNGAIIGFSRVRGSSAPDACYAVSLLSDYFWSCQRFSTV
jgi:hypothetical protein